MNTPFQMSIIGSSALYDSFIFSQLDKENKRIRCNITTENSISFPIEYTQQFGSIKGAIKKKDLNPIKLSARDVSSVVKSYPGAYVKQPYPEIIADQTMIIDMDATSMYPSNIKQGNISFDTYVARIIPPQCYPTINVLIKYLGTGQYPAPLAYNVQDYVVKYINKKDLTPKAENIQKYYYTTLSLFDKLIKSNRTFNQICDPTNTDESLLLKNILIPLLDILYTIHPTSEDYNDFVYDYLYYGMTSYDDIFENTTLLKQKYNNTVWVIKNPSESNTQIISMTIDEIINYIQQYNVCLSGCMFLKHDVKKGLFVDMLKDFAVLRKKHKKMRDSYEEGSKDYKFEDNNQNVFKRLMNTCYGLYGLSTFRYSNSWLARSITNNSLHALKCAIWKGEEYLNSII